MCISIEMAMSAIEASININGYQLKSENDNISENHQAEANENVENINKLILRKETNHLSKANK